MVLSSVFICMKEALLIHWFSLCFGCHMTNSVPWLLVVGAVKAACPGGEFEARKQATTRLRGEVKWRNNLVSQGY